MNQLCKVCGEPAAGFHFGAFTCEGCKSFFGRTYNNLSQVHECKNGGQCVINKQNRTSCKACRLRKCLMVGMSKSGSRYGRRSNWFKIHCLLQEQASQLKGLEGGGGGPPLPGGLPPSFSLSPASMPALSPAKSEDEAKVDSPLLSSPESCQSEGSIDVDRRPHSPGGDGGRGPGGLALYLHPGLSLLHASHLYSRLYPPVLYPGLANSLLPQTRPPPPPSPKRDMNSPPHEYAPPPPPFMLPLGLPLHRKRGADSPLETLPIIPPRVWEGNRAPEQDVPMDLSVKRQRLLPPLPPPPAPPVSPPASPIPSPIATPTPPTTTPVDLTTKT